MKKLKIVCFKWVTAALLLGSSFWAFAQKLPNVQTVSLRAPANIKIDGKTTEWGNNFQAYNHATDIFYTLANDDDRLYLIIKATDLSVISKILAGGITFTMQKSGKNNDKGGIRITYPIFEEKLQLAHRGQVLEVMGSIDGNSNSGTAPVTAESVVTAHNKTLAEKSKVIRVTGIPGLDTTISVYNEDGIKTAERFDLKGTDTYEITYTYELGIDLKQLGLSFPTAIRNDPPKFTYHIALNSTNSFDATIPTPANPADAAAVETKMAKVGEALSPTDFWGEYTLAKK